jgi:hypothetical protein
VGDASLTVPLNDAARVIAAEHNIAPSTIKTIKVLLEIMIPPFGKQSTLVQRLIHPGSDQVRQPEKSAPAKEASSHRYTDRTHGPQFEQRYYSIF